MNSNALRHLALATALSMLALGCASRRVEHFRLFAEAGRSYSRAVDQLAEEAGKAAIDADSELLAKDRDRLSAEQRRTVYLERTEALRELLHELRELRRHALLLERYFTTLSRIADDRTPEATLRATAEIVEALRQLHPTLAGAIIGDRPVDELMRQSRPLLVAEFRNRALTRELRQHAELVARELELQRAILTGLTVELEADLQAIADARSYSEVAAPYIGEARLPANWQRRRREILSGYVMLARVDQAAKAAEELQRQFIDLAENRVRIEDWPHLVASIDAIFDLVELARQP